LEASTSNARPFHERGNLHAREQLVQPRGHAFGLSAPLRPGTRGGQAEQELLLDLVEPQDPRERFEDLRRGVLVAAALQPQVVVGADAGEQGHLLTPQPGNPTVGAPPESRPAPG
jgi:hypothetical protein